MFGAGVNPNVNVPPTSFAALSVSPDSPYLGGVLINGVDRFVTVYTAPKSALSNPATIPWKLVIRPEDKITDATIHGTTVYAVTAKNAPRFKVIKFDVTGGSIGQATDVIPAGARVIDGAAEASDALYVFSREDGLARVTRVGYDGAKTRGAAAGQRHDLGPRHATRSPGIHRAAHVVDVAAAVVRVRPEIEHAHRHEARRAVSGRLLEHRRGGGQSARLGRHADPAVDRPPPRPEARRSNPTLLNAYGSYGISQNPGFSAGRMAWFELGGITAVAHVRGGGEYGEEWHLAGKDANKVKTISDFVDCGKWLIAKGYTSAAKLGARGGSAGGITMGGAITTAPDVFAAVLDEIPVSDQLRIESTPNGPPNVPEFGSVKTEQGFKNLYATSAVHHVVKGTKYPAVMLTTGINDPRVDPWQAAKMAAALQDATTSGKPILLRVDYEGGHGGIGAGPFARRRTGRRRVRVPAVAVRRTRVPADDLRPRDLGAW